MAYFGEQQQIPQGYNPQGVTTTTTTQFVDQYAPIVQERITMGQLTSGAMTAQDVQAFALRVKYYVPTGTFPLRSTPKAGMYLPYDPSIVPTFEKTVAFNNLQEFVNNGGFNGEGNIAQGFRNQDGQGYPTGPNQGYPTGPQGYSADQPQGSYPTGPNQGYPTGPNQGYAAGPNQGYPTGPNQGYSAAPTPAGFEGSDVNAQPNYGVNAAPGAYANVPENVADIASFTGDAQPRGFSTTGSGVENSRVQGSRVSRVSQQQSLLPKSVAKSTTPKKSNACC